MTRGLFCLALPLLLTLSSCSDDGGPTHEAGAFDAPSATDGPAKSGDATLPWPDLPSRNDTTPWKCTPKEPNMCDGYKTQHCSNGTCTPCPANYVDCDRQGDCECFGACNGSQCVKSGG